MLLRVSDAQARSFHEIEAARESWSVRESERQIASLLFERLAMDREPARVRSLAEHGQQITVPAGVLKDRHLHAAICDSSRLLLERRASDRGDVR